MRFGPDIHVFPGGRLDPEDADAADAAVRETREETGIAIRREHLVPMTRWVTPPGLPYRFDVRFFAALVPAGTEIVEGSDEVVDAVWMTPSDALDAMRRGTITLWQPTFVTLQQLDGLLERHAIERAFAPGEGPMTPPSIAPAGGSDAEDAVEAIVRQPWAGGVDGRMTTGRLLGRREIVVVDPSDPTGETTDAVLAWAAGRSAEVVGVAVSDLDPTHHAGVEMWATGYGLPVVGGPGASGIAPYPITELRDGEAIPFGDVRVVVRRAEQTGAPRGARPERIELEVEGGPSGRG